MKSSKIPKNSFGNPLTFFKNLDIYVRYDIFVIRSNIYVKCLQDIMYRIFDVGSYGNEF